MHLRIGFFLLMIIMVSMITGCASVPPASDGAAIHTPCTLDRAYYAGLAGWSYADVCSLDKPELKIAYERGVEKSAALASLSKERSERDAEAKRIDEDESVVNHIGETFNLMTTGSTTPSEDARVRSAEKRLENAPGVDVTPDFRTPGQNTASYFAPGLSALVGFGTGHAIQERWLRDGWIWTAVDVGMLVGIGATAAACKTGEPCSAPGAFFLGLLGSRVWQTVDTFREARRRQPVRVLPAVGGAGGVAPGVTVAVGF